LPGDRSSFRSVSFETVPSKPKQTKGVSMNTRTHTVDYYRRMLWVQSQALKRLYTFAKIMACNCGQEIPNNPGLRATGTTLSMVPSGAAPCVRTDGGRSLI
jgi:CRP/FNR family nitrogen fixation transcriptional regulator